MENDYGAVATSAKAKARDILRAQMAVRIQERMQNAKDAMVSAVRHYAALVVNFAKGEKDAAEEAAKRAERRDAFTQALGSVPGVTPEDLALASAALDSERADNDAERAEKEAADAKAHAEELAGASTRIVSTKEAYTHAANNLEKLNKGELKVDADELKELANKLIEEERADS